MEYIYATLTLSEMNSEINEENLTNVLEAAGADDVIESRVKALVAALEGVDVGDIADEMKALSDTADVGSPDVMQAEPEREQATDEEVQSNRSEG